MGKHYSMHEAAGISIRCAADYQKNLENKNYIFIFQNRETNQIDFFEAVFLPRHFIHLTGLHYTENYRAELQLKEKELGARNFYDECLNKTIKLHSYHAIFNGLILQNVTGCISNNKLLYIRTIC